VPHSANKPIGIDLYCSNSVVVNDALLIERLKETSGTLSALFGGRPSEENTAQPENDIERNRREMKRIRYYLGRTEPSLL
jgi:hypothetical protein